VSMSSERRITHAPWRQLCSAGFTTEDTEGTEEGKLDRDPRERAIHGAEGVGAGGGRGGDTEIDASLRWGGRACAAPFDGADSVGFDCGCVKFFVHC